MRTNQAINFSQFYRETLEPGLLGIEPSRKVVFNNLRYTIICWSVAIVFMVVSFWFEEVGWIGFIVLLITGSILFGYYRESKKKYVAAFKESVIFPIIKSVNPQCIYQPERAVSHKDCVKSGLFLKGADAYEGDDYVEGLHGSTYFCFSEMIITKQGDEHSRVILFKGLFFIADFNKHFSGRTYVWSEANPQLTIFKKIFSSFTRGIEPVLMEDPEFEKRFIVYSSDQVEARFILSPSMMVRMIGLEEKFGKSLVFSFIDSNIYVAVPSKMDLFEPTIPVRTNEQTLNQYYNAVVMTMGIIDELNLNMRIWNK